MSLLAGFCAGCQEVLAPYSIQCPSCADELVPLNIMDVSDGIVVGAGEAIETGDVLRFGMEDPADHVRLLADLILRVARAA
jgi:hypothetical protein